MIVFFFLSNVRKRPIVKCLSTDIVTNPHHSNFSPIIDIVFANLESTEIYCKQVDKVSTLEPRNIQTRCWQSIPQPNRSLALTRALSPSTFTILMYVVSFLGSERHVLFDFMKCSSNI